MSFNEHINEICYAKEPTPTYEQEDQEHDDVFYALRSQHHGQSYQQFAYPVYAGDKKENCFDEGGLTIKPFIKLHN